MNKKIKNVKKTGSFSEEAEQIILDSVSDGVFTVDNQWRITSFNRAAERILKLKREDALGKPCCEVFRANICERACALRQTLKTGKPIVNKTIQIISSAGKKIPISISTGILKNGERKIIGGVETFRDLSFIEKLKTKVAKQNCFLDIISKNPRIQRIFQILPDIAESESTVLIEGKSGTGKELFAKAIHKLSKRKKRKLITVNCGALPDSLLESELFGYKKGAFTDAKFDKLGRFALAEGGSIFLDEIGEIPLSFQTRLLRILEEKEYEPLGATITLKANVRVIAATNQSLKELVDKGKFREDLYYRINIIPIEIPSLSQRKEDIPLLIEHFCDLFNKLRGKYLSGVSSEAMKILLHYDYPGNIRELENIIEHAFVLCKEGEIETQHLPDYLLEKHSIITKVSSKDFSLRESQKNLILNALKRNNWNRLAAANELGIHKSTLFRKIKTYKINLQKKGL
ncbi:sigma-54 interaction domain-containing protein [Candidatus Riflebacteria bacterium]